MRSAGRLPFRAIVLAEQGELVAAQAAEGHAALQLLAQARADGLQQGIAEVVTEAFVDVLEVVEVDQQQRAAALVRPGAFKVLLGAFGEQQPIRQRATGRNERAGRALRASA